MNTVFLALGSNLGDRLHWLQFANESLLALDNLTIEAVTDPVETTPLGGLDQPPYLNLMVRGIWCGTADSLLAQCHRIEAVAGRKRIGSWQSRELDIDLVRFGSQMCDRKALTLPHPGVRDREFWAQQLAELERDG